MPFNGVLLVKLGLSNAVYITCIRPKTNDARSLREMCILY